MSTLIIRFSPISNVAMLVPLLESMTRLQPDEQFVVVSRTFLKPLFAGLKNVTFVGADLRHAHKGVGGTFRLFKELKQYDIQRIIDLQANAKSRFLSFLFKITAPLTPWHTIGCYWWHEWRLMQRGHRRTKPLKSIFERYNDCFAKAGFKTDEQFTCLPNLSTEIPSKITDLYGEKRGAWIGVAPFAQHQGKILPSKRIKEVIAHFDAQPDTQIFLFGAGEVEYEMLSDWETLFHQTHAVYTALNLQEEFELMRHLDVMVSMDSANMHLASLTDTPVVSIWGASHPGAGSLGWKQSPDNIVEKDLPCRPCSILGNQRNKRCPYRYECLNLAPQEIIGKIERVLNRRNANA